MFYNVYYHTYSFWIGRFLTIGETTNIWTFVFLRSIIFFLSECSDLPGPEGRPHGSGFQEGSEQERRCCSHQRHQRALQWGNSAFHLWLVRLHELLDRHQGTDWAYDKLSFKALHVKWLKTLFQSRSASPSPTTSTQLWRKTLTVNIFCPLTLPPDICLKLWETASYFGTIEPSLPFFPVDLCSRF